MPAKASSGRFWITWCAPSARRSSTKRRAYARPAAGTKFGRIGADEREVLEYVPSHFKRVVDVRPKMSCRACETVVQVPMPTLPIEKRRPGPALLAYVVVPK
jgi:transposase